MIRHIIGTIGSLLTGLCCLGFAPLIGILTAAGAGFLLQDIVLIPLFAVFLGITLWGLRNGRKCHGNGKVFRTGFVLALTAFIALWFMPLLTYLALAGLVVVSVWDLYLIRMCRIREIGADRAGRE